ncbi:hypothetical protein [Flavobacterium psychrophilum]|uniref:hypothetical protein n=1 Tax=Flavobacterium psychrophilum TaxID=96345 RepID=UPI000B7C2197|nr:hypothetical protein [Flavobacterium psychrophilum]MCB6089436.1 hypothetical protein [Flavobacterium psychrophilum]MCB6232106.1 hypothetical protein [Flavobacterium psychrophilum]SNA88406.1 hypothetical protein FI146_850081 [Flavobacterium psychrophilum]SNB13628.1 hypothetical protein JIP1600_2270001 [Flavobacterium psychrophilum]
MNVLGKFWDANKYRNIISFDNDKLLSDEYIGQERGGLSGEYLSINEILIAIFSYQKKNYILIDKKLYKLNNNISIQYHCEQSIEDRSWIKIYNEQKLILYVDYKNDVIPFNNPFDGFEDWEVVNFAYHLAGYINKVRKIPDVILFAN